ncbi:longevity assurance proteins LAG1/LAC1 [Leucogyrophana mollusca]|uniref:Longevity assurance proteins LAG1/LAC1 n=1 Tax=Leucogyrophana mollusca TaxID=85980 RepID=A0ACB8B7P7_9AGAM|nr:longevity assurance proteins LAG1/LAC1 [Leucogyrophana mollusca]
MAPPGAHTEKTIHKRRGRSGSLRRIETDPAHHLTGPFLTQTPIGSNTPESISSPVGNGFPRKALSAGLWSDIKSARWVVEPASSFKLLVIPIILYINWHILAPYIAPQIPNPFAPFLFISHHVPTSSPEDPRYAKGYLDLVFVAYHIIFYSFVRQFITITLCRPIAKYFGLRKQTKLDRFGEQGYALVYFAVMGAWGFRIMGQLPTYWYRTDVFFIDYPHWDMKPELKRYYLMHAAYWCQQLVVLLLGLEKPRKDYTELVAHHFVTLWLIFWSYLVNMTLIGNAVYMSMDIPDAFLAFSKLLNYMRWGKSKVVSFSVFLCVWTYFRHWLNLVMLWSVWNEFDLMPESSKKWEPKEGVWMTWWMKYQMFAPILLLQFLNLFWYFLIWRILFRSIVKSSMTDERSDDEDDGEDEADAIEVKED